MNSKKYNYRPWEDNRNPPPESKIIFKSHPLELKLFEFKDETCFITYNLNNIDVRNKLFISTFPYNKVQVA